MLREQVARQLRQRLILEKQRLGQGTEIVFQLGDNLHHHHRVDPVFAQQGIGLDPLLGQPKFRGHQPSQMPQHRS
ncbi:hypothetical protein D3C75_1237240 [compost metagenome]